jgi:hypothetical protein
VLSVAAFCHKTSGCSGTLTATAKGKRIGGMHYKIDGKKTVGLKFRFNKAGRRLFKRSHNRLSVTITVAGEPAAASNTAARTLLILKR